MLIYSIIPIYIMVDVRICRSTMVGLATAYFFYIRILNSVKKLRAPHCVVLESV